MTVRSSHRYVLAAVLLLAAAALPLAQAHAQTRGTSLTKSHHQEPPNWNYWATSASALSVPTFHNVQEPLVERLGDGSVAPLLAESWTVSPDGLTYVFKIRTAKFHDGSNLEAADVVYSLLRNKESPLATTKLPLAPVASIEAVDPRTVKLTLTTPSQRLLSELGTGAGIIVPRDLHTKVDLNTKMIGTGPYIFGEYKPDVHLKLSAFDGYWGPKPYFRDVTHRFIKDETAALNALLAGQIDMVGSLAGEGLDRVASIKANPKFQVIMSKPSEVSYIFLSTRSEALRDARVRQAIAHAVERDELVTGGQSGFADVTCLMVIPPTEPWNSSYCPYKHDLAKAKSLLAAAGKANLTLDFPSLNVAEFPAIKDILVSQLAKAGITLKVRPLDLPTWFERVNTNGEYEISTLSSAAKAEAYVCKGGRQPLGRDNSVVCDETFDKLILKADSIVNRDEYLKTMKEAVNTMADSAWVIPLHQKSTPTVARADLEGFKDYRYRNEMDLRKLRWKN